MAGTRQSPTGRSAERARASGARGGWRAWLSGLLAAAIATAPGAAFAGPKGGKVAKGKATIQQSGSHTQIDTYKKKTVIDWRSFDVGAGETVRIQQPSQKARTLNRVSDAGVTQIDGSVTSNGQVWIVNPGGVYFGGEARVEVQGLVAGAGEVSNKHFKKGKQRLSNLAGEVRNDGTITANDGVTLAGMRVANVGHIVTRDGNLVMAAGDEVWVTRHGTHVQVRIDGLAAHADPETPSVENSGRLDAGRGSARLAAGDFLGLAIKNTGEIHARNVSLTAGAESVVDVAGRLDARGEGPGETGGHIEVLGEFVRVEDAVLDASGDAGGGTVWVGGARPGRGGVPAAEGTFVGGNTELRADATRRGDGGEVVIFAKDAAEAHGLLSARGGPRGGDGGFVETSAKVVNVSADVDVRGGGEVSGSRGAAGTWLIDPINVDIVETVPVDPDDPFLVLTGTDDGAVVTFAPGGEPQTDPQTSFVSADSIAEALGRGGDVVVTTESSDPTSAGTAEGNINVDAPIVIPVYQAGDDEPQIAPDTFAILTLRAANDINVNESIVAESGADLTLGLVFRANDNVEMAFIDGEFQLEPEDQKRIGTLRINPVAGGDAELRTNGGFIVATAANIEIDGDIVTEGGVVDMAAFDLARFFENVRDASDDTGEFGRIEVNAQILTGGGDFTSQCQCDDFVVTSAGRIDVTETELDDDETAEIRLDRDGSIQIEGTLIAENVRLSSGADGDGDVVLGTEAGTGSALIRSLAIDLDAGDGRDPDGTEDDADAGARIVVYDDVRFEAIDPDDATTRAPDSVIFAQDAAITDADLPGASQFGDAADPGVDGMLYIIQTRDGSSTSAPDLVVGDASSPGDPPADPKFDGADLILLAPDTIELGAVISPETVELALDNGFTVTQELADNLRPTTGLRFRAGALGEGDLDFAQAPEGGAPVELVAPEVGLRAGSGSDSTAAVDIEGDTEIRGGASGPLTVLEIIQDADLDSANIALPEQLTDYTGGDLSGLSLSLISGGGSVTLGDADVPKVEATDLTLTALTTIDILPEPAEGSDDPPPLFDFITVERADVGGVFDFDVSQDLIDKIVVTGSTEDPRTILTLRATLGLLGFEETVDDVTLEGEPVRVTADVIELVGDTIDIGTNAPIFQTLDVDDNPISPQRLIYNQSTLIDDSDVPTEENFPEPLIEDGPVGPTEYMVFQSDGDASQIQILLDQANLDNVTQGAPPEARGWSFPIQETTIVALAAPGVGVTRLDGFDLELGEYDQMYATALDLAATFQGDPTMDPLGEAVVDAIDAGLITGFDPTLDFTTPTAPTITVDGEETTPEQTALERFGVIQDGDVLRGAGSRLPDFGALQPETYSVTADRGIIEVDNARFGGTNLVLEVRTTGDLLAEGELPIEFEAAPLMVETFEARVSTSYIDEDGLFVETEFLVDANAHVVAEESITLAATGVGPLRFAGPDGSVMLDSPELSLFANGDTSSYVDAKTNAPSFVNTVDFDLSQGTTLLNGFVPLDEEVVFGTIPAKEQFADLSLLETYELETIAGDIEINDPSDLLIAESVTVRAGTTTIPRDITLRADIEGEDDLVLIDGPVRGLSLVAGDISLEAPRGSVDAGDARASFTLEGLVGTFAIRQQDALTAADGESVASVSQFNGDILASQYLVQSMEEVTVGTEFADRIEQTSLLLKASLLEEDFDAALGSVRGGEPDEDFPDAVYDRFADANHDGVVDESDRDVLDAAPPAFVQVSDPDDVVELTLQSLRIESEPDDGAPIRVGAANILTEEDQTYRDQIQLVGEQIDAATGAVIPANFRALAGLFSDLNPTETEPSSSLTFEYEIDGLNDNQQAFVANASNLVSFGGDIGGETPLGDFTVNLQQLITFTDEAPVAAASFGGDDGSEFLVRAQSIALNPDSGTKGSIFENPDVPQIATFYHEGGDLTFDTGAGGRFVMGANQKLSTNGGTLTINTSGNLRPDGTPRNGPSGIAKIGDLSAIDRILVASGSIQMQRREGGEVERANGLIETDRGTDIVANEIDFFFDFDAETDPGGAGTLRAMQGGSGKDVRFGLAPTTQTPAFLESLQVLDLQFNLLSRSADGNPLRPVLDGTPDGISRTDISRVFWTSINEPTPTVLAAHRISNPNELAAIGVRLQPSTSAERRGRARGTAIYDDLESTSDMRGGLVDISEDRLIAEEVEKARRLHARLFGVDGANAPKVREALQEAVDDYRRSTGARRVVGFELRRYIYNRPSTQYEAYQALQSLDSLFRHHRRSGLTAAEYGAIQRDWLRRVKPDGISVEQLSELINPSRYIRGSDVLDIFGD